MPSAVADALLPAPVNPAQPPQGFWGNAGRFAYDALGLGDVAKALQGQMTPTEAQDFAFGAAMGLIPMSRGLKPVQKGIRAYHGSPHDFDRFDISKIGTGEGAQAYGHGIYFADNPAVAQSYRDTLSGVYGKGVPDDLVRSASGGLSLNNEQLAVLRHFAGEKDLSALDAAKRVQWRFSDLRDDGPTGNGPIHRGLMAAIEQTRNAGKGRMYEVNINAHPDQFLDWDKPLSKQPHVVEAIPELAEAAKKEAYNRALSATHQSRADQLWSMVKDPLQAPGGFAMDTLSPRKRGGGREAAVSAMMNERGVPGVQYLDQGSRTAGEGSRNYVVFDDKLIDIIKKYGLAALGLPPAMTAGNQIWNSQTQQ
jgi:hypothetical protein